MKIRFLLLAAGILTLNTVTGQTLTLDSCQQMAQRNYPAVKQYDLIEKSKEFSVSNAGKGWLPQLSLTGIGAYVIQGLPSSGQTDEADKFQFIGMAQFNQTLWDGGASKSQKAQATAAADVARAETDVEMIQLRERVEQVYFAILLLDDRMENLKILTDNLNRQLNAVETARDNGRAYVSDADEVRIELLKAGQQVTDLNHTRSGYLTVLGLLTGQSLTDQTALEKPVQPEAAFSENKRPELAVYTYRQQQAESEWSMKHTGLMPRIALTGTGLLLEPGANFGMSKLNTLAFAGLSVSWNIGGVYRNKNDRELNQLTQGRLAIARETFTFNNKLQQTEATEEMARQQALIGSDNEIVSLRGKVRQAYELKYQNGLCSLNDVLNATNAEHESRNNQSLHQTQWLQAIYHYKTLTGN